MPCFSSARSSVGISCIMPSSAWFLMFVNVGCTFEFFRMVGQQGAVPSKVLGYLFAVAMLAMVAVAPLMDVLVGFKLVLFAIILLPTLFALSAIVQLWKHSEQPFRDAAYTMVPMLYIAVPLSLMLAMVPEVGARVVLMVILMVWINDSGAYIGGSLFGKHKMWVRHSPGKTWEGTAFGVVVTILVAIFLGSWLQPALAWYHWAALGVICSVVDTLGDLVESMLKRSVSRTVATSCPVTAVSSTVSTVSSSFCHLFLFISIFLQVYKTIRY